MRVDIDKLEALHGKGAHAWCWETFDAFPELVSEVRELRGIAEAARAFRDKKADSVGEIQWHDLLVALARYDAGGAK